MRTDEAMRAEPGTCSRFGFPDTLPPSYTETTFPKDYNLTVGQGSSIAFGSSVVFTPQGRCYIRGNGSLLVIFDGAVIQGTTFDIDSGGVVLVGPKARIRGVSLICKGNSSCVIGEGTSWESGAAIIDNQTNIYIGRDCMFSSGVILRTEDGHGIFDAATHERINAPADVIVEDHVWIGNGARVNKGSTIGRGSVIGQMSVASGSLEAGNLYAGVPARKLRDGIVWSRYATYDTVPEEFRINEMIGVAAQ